MKMGEERGQEPQLRRNYKKKLSKLFKKQADV